MVKKIIFVSRKARLFRALLPLSVSNNHNSNNGNNDGKNITFLAAGIPDIKQNRIHMIRVYTYHVVFTCCVTADAEPD